MNEPVAWLVDNQAYTVEAAAESLSRILETPVIPLYTNLVKEQLTDEEITAIWYEPTLRYDPVAFARAILRKAQENDN